MSDDVIGLPDSIDPAGWAGMLALGVSKRFRRGEIVFTERAAGDSLYVIASGPVEIVKQSTPDADLRLAILEKGAVFGERCLFGDTRRSATAKAYSDLEVIEIPAEALRKYLENTPAFALQFYRYLCEKFSQMIYDVDSDLRSLYLRLSTTISHTMSPYPGSTSH